MKELELNLVAEKPVKDYYDRLAEKALKQFQIACNAREKGKDVCFEVESTPARDLADRCENIIGPKGIAERYRKALKENNGDRIKTIFQIFREMIEEKWIKIPDKEKRLEQAVKTALVLVTEGVVVAPLDGVPSIKISENFDGSKFVDIYYAGPIRAAGGTATVFPLILGDYARKLLELDRYKPTEEEIERYVEETRIYDEIVTRQYKLKSDEVRKIIRGCPVCINGEPTEEREVTAYKNLERIPSNRIRGGMCLVISEGIALKAMKILGYAKMLGLDWSWLENIIKVDKSTEREKSVKPSTKYLTRLAAGRPIFCYPSRIGGFRLRYGRTRTSGIMAKGMHPATMYLLDEFVAVGTQLKVERPGKSAGIFPCDSIEGPIVKLTDEEVKKISSLDEAMEVKDKVKKILFLGDLLISYGDFCQTAHSLIPVGYCEEWWKKELEKIIGKGKKIEGINSAEILENPFTVDGFTAVELSMQLGIPLHPAFIHYFTALNREELLYLAEYTRKCRKLFEENKVIGFELENESRIKELYEKIGLPHRIVEGKILVEEKYAYPFLKTVGALTSKEPKGENVLEILSELSGIKIKDKGGSFIGARMGRPEASRPRKMIGNPSILFPIGLAGENIRSINKAMYKSQGKVEVEAALFMCPECKEILPLPFCSKCKKRTEKIGICPKCNVMGNKGECESCGSKMASFNKRRINLEELMVRASKNLKMKVPELVKGVKGLINEEKIPEPLEKGLLRAHYDLHIFRDGTIRYELLNAPLTHFKPSEIGISLEKLRELGYRKDFNGKELVSEEQLIELFPQDIIIHEEAGDFMVKVSQFIDDLLERFYELESYHKIKSRKELIGELVLGLAPHTSAAIVGRVIGYTKARVGFGHPYFHQCKRRNIDGDQDSLMLLLDGLLNFSQHYLPSSRGGRMDAPLAFTIALNPSEIDDEVHNMEICTEYPLELYEKATDFTEPKLDSIKRVKDCLGKKEQYSGMKFTHETSLFDAGPKISKYVQLKTMEEKINSQAQLQNKIAAVEKKDALERVMVSHFLPDIIGNARAFSRQTFRCTKCNERFRRIPLIGKCTKCGGNIILTIAQGSVRKYLKIAKEIIHKYNLSDYLKQRIKLTEQEVNSIFEDDKTEQKSLLEFV